jgi:hypothetical protein
MKGGAVRLARSPLKDAMDWERSRSAIWRIDIVVWSGTTNLEEGTPATSSGGGGCLWFHGKLGSWY